MVAEALEAFPKLTADAFKGSPIEAEYQRLSPTPDDFPNFVRRVVATASKGHDFGADKLKVTTTPMFFIHGDADGVRLAHIAEMFRLKGGEIHGDLKPRSASRLAILPDTTLHQRKFLLLLRADRAPSGSNHFDEEHPYRRSAG